MFASLRWSLRKPVLVACFTLYPIDFLLTVEMCKDNKGSGGQADSGADPASLVALRAEEARLAAEVQAMALQVAAKRVSWKCFARRFALFMELLCLSGTPGPASSGTWASLIVLIMFKTIHGHVVGSCCGRIKVFWNLPNFSLLLFRSGLVGR